MVLPKLIHLSMLPLRGPGQAEPVRIQVIPVIAPVSTLDVTESGILAMSLLFLKSLSRKAWQYTSPESTGKPQRNVWQWSWPQC